MSSDQHWQVTPVPASQRASGGPVKPGVVVALFGGCPIPASRFAEIVGNPFTEEEDVD